MARPNVLFLAHRVPYPPDKGDRIRTFQILRWLSQRAAVHLACLADEPVAPADQEKLHRTVERLAIVPHSGWSRWPRVLGSLISGGTASEAAFASAELRAIVESWGRENHFHVALASASSLASYLRLPGLHQTPVVVDVVDVDSQKWLDYGKSSPWPLSWLYNLEGQRLRRLEQHLPGWAHGVLLSSEAEKTLYTSFANKGIVLAVNNGVDLEYFQPLPPAVKPRCVFVGALDYRPNVDAACWFCREVWPLILKQRPDARLALVGRRPTKTIMELAKVAGVEVVGQVPDVRPYVGEASVVVVPLRLARGVQNKVLEGLAMAKAVVASPAALSGVRAKPGEHLLAATSPDEWVEVVINLFDHPDLRAKLGGSARRYVEEQHRWERCLEPLSDLLRLPQASSAPRASEVASS